MAMITDYLENTVCCNRNTMEFKTFVCILTSSDAQNSFLFLIRKSTCQSKRIPQAGEIRCFATTPPISCIEGLFSGRGSWSYWTQTSQGWMAFSVWRSLGLVVWLPWPRRRVLCTLFSGTWQALPLGVVSHKAACSTKLYTVLIVGGQMRWELNSWAVYEQTLQFFKFSFLEASRNSLHCKSKKISNEIVSGEGMFIWQLFQLYCSNFKLFRFLLNLKIELEKNEAGRHLWRSPHPVPTQSRLS